MCARREEDPISATLKVITLIKAVMCGDGQAGEDGGTERRTEAKLPSFLWGSLGSA